ncbi:hypothetical protein HID58_056788, partial [Brassica napus]
KPLTMNGCLIDSAGRLESCFNTVEVWLLRFWEARNDSLAINSKSMEGSLVLALMLDEASSPVHRFITYQSLCDTLDGTCIAKALEKAKPHEVGIFDVENPHYIQQPHFKIHLSEGFSFKNLRGYLLSRALDGRQTYIFLVAGGLRRTSPAKNLTSCILWDAAYVQLLHFQTMDKHLGKIMCVLMGMKGISEWENMDELENSTVTWNSMVTSVENYTAMKWPVDCLHYTQQVVADESDGRCSPACSRILN